MKLTVLVMIFLFVVPAQAAEWILAQEMEGTKLWKHKRLPEVRLAQTITTPKKVQSLSYYQSHEFQRLLQDQKKKALEFFGVRDLKIQVLKVEEKNNEIIVHFKGSYLDHAGVTTFYEEKHLYGDKKITQFLMTAPSAKSLSPTLVREGFGP